MDLSKIYADNTKQNNEKDEMYTPDNAIAPLIKHLDGLDKEKTLIWECADTPENDSNIASKLREAGYKVVTTSIHNGQDFLKTETPDGVTHIITNPPFCYDSETEVLTFDGWKNIQNIEKNDLIMSMNIDSKEIKYANINDTTKQLYSGDMYSVNTKYIDLFITPNHRMVLYDGKGNIKKDKDGEDLIKIKDVAGDQNYLPIKDFIWNGNEIEYFELERLTLTIREGASNSYNKEYDKKIIKMDDFLRFFGLWLADGHCRGVNGGEKRYDVGIKQHSKTSDEVRDILNNLGLGYKEYHNDNDTINFNIYQPQLYNFLFELGNSREKYIPKIFKNLSKRQIKIMLDSYIFGDSHASGKALTISTMSKKLSDDLSECFLKIGRIVSFTPRQVIARGKNYGDIYVGIYHQNIDDMLNIKIKKKLISRVENFNGYVYGIELKENHTMLVRRNGKICFSGNSNKESFIKSCFDRKLPFALLMPLAALEGKVRVDMYIKNDIQLLCFDKRIKFVNKDGESMKSPPFSSCWFCNGILKKQICFEKI